MDLPSTPLQQFLIRRVSTSLAKLKALSDDGQSMRQAEHLVSVVHKPSGGQDGHVINYGAQE